MSGLLHRAIAAAKEDVERSMLIAALDACDLRVSRAAQLLGVSRYVAYKKMRRLGLTRGDAARLRRITMPPVELQTVR